MVPNRFLIIGGDCNDHCQSGPVSAGGGVLSISHVIVAGAHEMLGGLLAS